MRKKIYFLIGAIVIIVAIITAGVYWYFQNSKTAVYSEEQEINRETENLSQDVNDLEIIGRDKSLDTLDGDLSAVAGETPIEQQLSPVETSTVDVSELENLENDLGAELEGISGDLTDLKGFDGDTSLDSLDTSLSKATQ